MNYNKRLARMESYYGITKSKPEDPLNISDFINYALENPKDYKLEGISKDYFLGICEKTPEKAIKIVRNILLENGHNISYNSIEEGIEVFKIDI